MLKFEDFAREIEMQILGTDKSSLKINSASDTTIVVSFSPAKEDAGILIGRDGKMINAVRMILKAAGRKMGKNVVVDMIK
jgi:predicted RNA-binding protein YlqC (UPF0109 family)